MVLLAFAQRLVEAIRRFLSPPPRSGMWSTLTQCSHAWSSARGCWC